MDTEIPNLKNQFANLKKKVFIESSKYLVDSFVIVARISSSIYEYWSIIHFKNVAQNCCIFMQFTVSAICNIQIGTKFSTKLNYWCNNLKLNFHIKILKTRSTSLLDFSGDMVMLDNLLKQPKNKIKLISRQK